MNQNNEQKKNKNISNKIILWMMCMGIIIIILVNVAITIYWGIKGIPSVYSGEAALLSTGIGIIGFAIAVWAGLNISNLVSRRDIDRLKASLKNLHETTESEVKPYIKQSQETIFQQFLVEMERVQEDPIMQYFVELFRKESKDIKENNIPYAKLIEIETRMVHVALLHRSDYKKNETLIRLANEGLEIISQIENCPKVKEYLMYREAVFWFYKGYCDEDKVASAKDFWTVVKILQKDFFDEKLESNNKALSYLNNIIGESYSKIMIYYTEILKEKTDLEKKKLMNEYESEMEIIGLQAKYYCINSVQLMPTSINCRDLGCAYERIDRIYALNNKEKYKNSKKIINIYRWSVSLAITENEVPDEICQKAFRVLLMYYRLYIGDKLNDHGYSKEICDQCGLHISNMYAYAIVAKSDFPHCLRFQKLYAYSCYFVFRALAIGINIGSASGKVPEYFKKEMRETMNLLEWIDTEKRKKDEFMKELNKFWELIE